MDCHVSEVGNDGRMVDWPAFLGRHDLIWEKSPDSWFEAPFLGNGTIGTMIYRTGSKTVRLDVGRGDVYDHRKKPFGWWLHRCRLPVGYVTLETVGAIRSFTGRLGLWDAEFNGTITTDQGKIRLRSIVHATRPAMQFDLEPSDGERDCQLVWHPEPAEPPARTAVMESWEKMPLTDREKAPEYIKAWTNPDYVAHPLFETGIDGEIQFTYQPLRDGDEPSGETTTAWQERKVGNTLRQLLVTISHTFPEANSKATALSALKGALAADSDVLLREHRDWWHAYYPASFLSIPDGYWEGFYWIQMYKLASGTRADGPGLDLMGPWYHVTTWPCLWWNLNEQLIYSPVGDANRLDLGESLIGRMDRYRDILVANMPANFPDCAGIGGISGQDLRAEWSQITLGNLPWAMHNYWMLLRRSMDEKRMREKFFPLLRQTINTHLQLLTKGEDGRWHLPVCWSPEYPGGYVPDTSYDLALLRWGCQTLVEVCARFNIDDPLLPRWKDVLANLADFPMDANGFMIGAGLSFAMAHRHWSHLLAIYPLHLVNVDRPGDRELIAKSLRHFMSFEPIDDGSRSAYTWAAASSMASAMGMGDLALQYLNGTKQHLPFQEGIQGVSQTNTMYREAYNPVMETPLFMAQSLHEMLLQSWGGTIRIFPACPSGWKDAAFDNLRAEGAFLVSAVRRGGKTEWVRITSLAGEPCRVTMDGETRELKLAKGETTIIYPGLRRPVPVVEPVAIADANCFGKSGRVEIAT